MQQPKAIGQFKKLYSAFGTAQRKLYAHLVFLGFVNIVLDIFGLAFLYATALSFIDVEFHEKLTGLGFQIPSDWNSEELILFSTGVLAGIYILKSIVAFFISRRQIRLSYRMANEASSIQFSDFMRRNMLRNNEQKAVEHIHHLYSVPNSLADHLIMTSVLFFSEIIFLILVLLIVAVIQPQVLLLLFVTIIPVSLILLLLNRRKLMSYGGEINKITPAMYEGIVDSVYGFTDIRLHGRESYFLEKFNVLRDRFFKLRMKVYLRSSVAPIRIMESVTVVTLLIIAVYSYAMGQMSGIVALLTLFASIAFRALPSINRIISSFNTFMAMSYIVDMLPVDATQDNPATTTRVEFKHQLEIQDGSFAFTPDHKVINQIDFALRRGEMVGIKGASGSGKTTLINVLLGFYPLQEGQMILDGQPITSVLKGWQRKLAYVEQDAYMLAGSIEENVAFGEVDIDHAAVEVCLNQVSLSPWVNSLKEGVRTSIGDHGARISGGQRQRIAIARALYSKAEVFVFDEATNALDAETRDEVLQTIVSLKGMGLTVVIAAHDQVVLQHCDKVYSLKDGALHEA